MHCFSVKPVETSYPIYGKISRRLEHLTKLKTNLSKYESENIVVRSVMIYGPMY